ncbi:MAG: IMP dehydrogenase [Candidatus Heimdallarchaeum aukensis]|uniref:Inosine-5'-monophosphate dehydrogenase n=1 Tax=Candidatus Heimdallarchaeum aukensis TaxID=2876573 RepID=A0A9Y1BND0_9ARCH|nr:MAG: IMP dehydrogenase [Candidatus Heimdallarchaeum aukensis]
MKIMKEGLTFDDVLLIPKRSSVRSRREIDTSTQLSKNIRLNIPIVSANMDTVTESAMAIVMAQQGGIGIIHRFMPIVEQVNEVNKVKRAEMIRIDNPYCLKPETSLQEAKEFMKEKGISGLLITDNNNILQGILTSRDIKFTEDENVLVKELMSTDLITARPDISIEEAKNILKKNRIEKLPLVDEKGVVRGLITATDIIKAKILPKASKDSKGRLRVGAAIGVVGDYLERAEALYNAGADVLVLDIAHGHSDLAINAIKEIRKNLGDVELISGNVATAEGAKDLIEAGSDGIKTGVGPGSICITRVVAGAGVPQLTAIIETSKVAKDYGVPVIADGGIRTSGDITKAIAAGAQTVMIGSLLAGTEESPGAAILRHGRRYKVVRGMASLGATLGREAKEKKGSFDEFDLGSVVPEGVEAMVPYRGSAVDVLNQLVGGFRSGVSYCGASSIPEMQEKAEFIKITSAGRKESTSHDVELI